jgi:hypothetical protein
MCSKMFSLNVKSFKLCKSRDHVHWYVKLFHVKVEIIINHTFPLKLIINIFFTEIIEFQLNRKSPTEQTAKLAFISNIGAWIRKGDNMLTFFVFSDKIVHTDVESSSGCLQSNYG